MARRISDADIIALKRKPKRKPRGPNKVKVYCRICGDPQVAKELCKFHYARLLKTGTTEAPGHHFRPMTPALPMNDLDIAWLAGIVEGEGCFSKHASGFSILVAMTDEDIVQRLCAITGVGNVRKFIPSDHRKPYWTWRVHTTADAVRLSLAMAPLLGQRRREKLLLLLNSIDLHTKRGRV